MSRTNKVILITSAVLIVAGVYWASEIIAKKQTANTTQEQRIDAWIDSHNLNEYGDTTDTNYPGGTPLFNESTGQNENRYHYILRQHPDQPWNR